MNKNLVNWTHFYEWAPGVVFNCIIIRGVKVLFFFKRIKIFVEDGNIYNVHKEHLILQDSIGEVSNY